jgi:hypothetical protein
MTGKMNEVGGILVKLGFVPVGTHTVSTVSTAATSAAVPAAATQWMVLPKVQNYNITLDGVTSATTAVGFTLSTVMTCPITIPVSAGMVLWWIPVSTASSPTLCYQFGKDE